MNTKTFIVLMALVLSGCGQATPAVGSIQTAIAQTQSAQPVLAMINTLEATETEAPTNTPQATDTPASTDTPIPTDTPEPSSAPTQSKQKIVLEGTGDSVVDANKWAGMAFIHIVHSGSSNFSVTNYDANGDQMDLLVNTIGNYDGFHMIDYFKDIHSNRFEISADGPWTITLYKITKENIETIHSINVPGVKAAVGDDAMFVIGGKPDVAIIHYDGDSNFVVIAVGPTGEKPLVNEIGPYEGIVMVPSDTLLLLVTAEGLWTIQLSEAN